MGYYRLPFPALGGTTREIGDTGYCDLLSVMWGTIENTDVPSDEGMLPSDTMADVEFDAGFEAAQDDRGGLRLSDDDDSDKVRLTNNRPPVS